MALPQLIDVERLCLQPDAYCAFVKRWGISEELVNALIQMADSLEFGISMISGYRTEQSQDDLRRAGRPAAARGVSTHTSVPATGADLRPAIAVVNAVKARFGQAAVFAGLRWGGGSEIDPETGIPSDWNHVDLGRRM